ncbi:MAG: hypothetical protein KC543_04760 [Myxococcales bacterium]|nr:hypothetical protein [Myxococcales bacterium]
MKLLVAALAVALFGAAPFQCSSKQDPGLRIEDTPAQALWKLSQRFEAEGDSAACRATLSFLVERYPSALEAQQAKQVLAASSSAAGTSGGDHGSGTDADGASAPPAGPQSDATAPGGSGTQRATAQTTAATGSSSPRP